jgi:hypothetical protein
MLTLIIRTLLANRTGLTLGTRNLALVAELNMVRSTLRARKYFVHQDMHDAWPGTDPVDAPRPAIDPIPGTSCGSIRRSIQPPVGLQQVEVVQVPVRAATPGAKRPRPAARPEPLVVRPRASRQARTALEPLARASFSS